MERRLARRRNIPARAIIAIPDAPPQQFETMDISADGLFLITDQPLPTGTKVFMSLFIPPIPDKKVEEETLVEVEGTVARRTNAGMGVCFDHRHRFAWM
jgi:Tfp pilus assembly protein PilZ